MGLITAIPAPAQAAPADAFDCTDPRFFAMAENDNEVQLYEGSYTAAGTSSWTSLGGRQSGNARYNAIAFNPKDNHLYGVVSVTSGSVGHIVRINRDGSVTRLGQTSPELGTPRSALWDSGEFDSDGNYYVASGNAGSSDMRVISGLHEVTGTGGTRPATRSLSLSSSPRFADLAFKDGYLWSHNYGQSNTFYRIHISGSTAGQVDSFSSIGVLPSASTSATNFGSAFTMTNGNLAFVSTTGQMHQVAVANPHSANPGFKLVNTVSAPNNARSDAANCSTALPASLSVEKVGPQQVVMGETIQWDLTVTNEGPGVTSGFVLSDSLPSGLTNVSASSDDAGCTVNGAQTEVTCNGGRLAVGGTAEVTITATAPSRVGPVVNTARVVGNEDPDPDAPATAETEVTLDTIAEQPTTLEVIDGPVNSFDETSGEGGTVVFDPGASTFTYTPPAGFSGTDTYSYETPTGPVTVHIIVQPTADDDEGTTQINVPVTLTAADVLGNDIGIGLGIESVGAASHGVTEIVEGNIVYTPNPGFYGEDSFEYTIEGDGGTATATITVTISAAAPVATDDEREVDTNSSLTVSVNELLANDSGTGISVTGVDNPSTGTVEIVGGDVVFTPEAGFHGEATFEYTIGGPGGTDTATVTVTVSPLAPVAVDDASTGQSDTPLTVPRSELLANDSGTDVVVTVVANPSTGTVEIVAGDVVFTPAPGFHGDATFDYTIAGPGGTDTATVTVTFEPIAPGAGDDSFTTSADTAIVLTDLLSNDTGTGIERKGYDQPVRGSVTPNDDGDLVFTPNAGFSGTTMFRYDIEGPGGIDTATVTITVVPVANDDAYGTAVDTAVTLDRLLVNDSGVNLTVDAFTAPSNGTMSVNDDGSPVYTPNGGFSGVDTFEYTLAGAGGTDSAAVTITIAPEANDDSYETSSAVSVTLTDLLSNDRGVALKVNEHAQPANGSVSVSVDGNLVYTPRAGFSGDDTFEYTLAGDGGTDTATVSITVSPVAFDDYYATAIGYPTLIHGLLDNDLGVNLTIDSFTQPADGTVSVRSDGRLFYIPAPGFYGIDTFQYTVVGDGGSATATVTVITAPDAPVAEGDAFRVDAGSELTVPASDLLTNDSGTELAISGVSNPSNGTVDLVDGHVVFTPADGFSGTATFEYTIVGPGGPPATATVTITVAPVAVDDSYATDAETALVVTDLLANDSGLNLTLEEFTQPANGTVSVNDDGDVVYTPNAGFSGTDTFEYTVAGDGGSDTAMVTITVAPIANNDAYKTVAETPVTLSGILDNDLGSVLTITSFGVPAHGTLSLDDDGDVVYTPDAGFSGTETLTYVMQGGGGSDTGTVTITVAPVAADDAVETAIDTAVTLDALLANDSGVNLSIESVGVPSDGVTEIVDGDVVYTPNAGFHGTDSFVYTVVGDGGSATATVTVTVIPESPSTGDDTFETDAGSPLTFPTSGLLTNDSGTEVVLTGVSNPSTGTVVIVGDDVVFTPADGFSGTATFDYTVEGPGGSDTGTVTITVAPVAVDDTYATDADTAVILDALLANDSGVNLTVDEFTQPANGMVSVNDDGDVVYTPNSGFSGTDSFDYTIEGDGGSDTATVTIAVGPVAGNLSYSTPVETELTFEPASEGAGTGLTVVSIVQPEHGNVELGDNGIVTFTPAPGYSGIQTVEYTLRDEEGSESAATITLNVTPVADTDRDVVVSGESVQIDLVGNDIGNDLVVTSFTQPENGTVTVDSDGVATYTAHQGFVGSDSFTYTVTDVDGQTVTSTVTIEVSAVPEEPETTEPVEDEPETPTNPGGGLALTGPEGMLTMLAIALLLLAAGAAVVIARKRAAATAR